MARRIKAVQEHWLRLEKSAIRADAEVDEVPDQCDFIVKNTATLALRRGGVGHWAFLRAFTAAARAQSLNALGQAYLLVGKPNVVRIDPPESSNPIALDDVRRSLNELPLMARSLAEGSGHHVADLFLRDRVEPFIRAPTFDLKI